MFWDSQRWMFNPFSQVEMHLLLPFCKMFIDAVGSLLHATLYLGQPIQYQLSGLLLFGQRCFFVDTVKFVFFAVAATWSSLVTLFISKSTLITSLYGWVLVVNLLETSRLLLD
jgi:hypothetical protein